MAAAENRKLIEDAFTKWARGDGAAFFNLLEDNVRWTVIGSTPVSRTFTSKRDFQQGALIPMGEKLNGGIQPTVRDIIADGDKLALQWEGRATGKNGTIYHQTYCWVMRFSANKIVEGTAYLDTELITQLWK